MFYQNCQTHKKTRILCYVCLLIANFIEKNIVLVVATGSAIVYLFLINFCSHFVIKNRSKKSLKNKVSH